MAGDPTADKASPKHKKSKSGTHPTEQPQGRRTRKRKADTQAEPDNASKRTHVAKPASNASSLLNFIPNKTETEATSSALQPVKSEPTGQAHVIIPGVIVVSSGTGSGVSRSPSPEPESEEDDID